MVAEESLKPKEAWSERNREKTRTRKAECLTGAETWERQDRGPPAISAPHLAASPFCHIYGPDVTFCPSTPTRLTTFHSVQVSSGSHP